MSHDPREGPPTLPPGVEAISTPSGLEILEVKPGEGEAATEASTVEVRYRAWLAEGTFVDDSESRGAPTRFRVGEGHPPALDEAVRGMRVGGHRRVISPSDLAYGPNGNGASIPPYATLILDIELIATR